MHLLEKSVVQPIAEFNWEAIAAVSSVCGALINFALVITIYLGIESLREAQKARLIDIFIWTTERVQAIRDETHKLMNTDLSDVTSNKKLMNECRRVSGEFQQIAYLVRSGLVDEDHVYNMFGSLFVRIWEKLAPAIVAIRQQNGEPLTIEEGAIARADFEKLAKKFKERNLKVGLMKA